MKLKTKILKMKQNLVQKALMSSLANVLSFRELPNISAVEFEITPTSQKSESFFSDAIHESVVTGGKSPRLKESQNKGRREVKLANRVGQFNSAATLKWLTKLNLEETLNSLQGADISKHVFDVKRGRTFVQSALENDLKYRLMIHEFYLDKSKMRVRFEFNGASVEQVRTREALLRMNNLPVRLVKRVVKNDVKH